MADERTRSLGNLHILPDDILSQFFFQRLNPKNLSKCAEVSRFFYVFCRDEQLWKRHCINAHGENADVMREFQFKGSWFLTFLFPTKFKSVEDERRALGENVVAQNGFLYVPVSSHYLHTKWLRNHMDLSNFAPHASTIDPMRKVPVENARTLTTQQFDKKYDRPALPVLIENAGVEQWKAWESWRVERLCEKYPTTPFRVATETGGRVRYVPLSLPAYRNYMCKQHDEAPLYVFDPGFGEKAPEMVQEYEVPEYFRTDFFEVFPREKRPPFRWVIIGPARSGASWHVDPSGTSAWNTLLSGRKRWAMYPPHFLPPGVKFTPSSQRPTSPAVTDDDGDDDDGIQSSGSLFWYLEVYPRLPPDMRPVECVQEPGQTIFVPSGWWHMVLNIEDTVAVTQNFANRANLDDVCDAMIYEAEREPKRAEIWNTFRAALSAQHPNLTSFVDRRIAVYADSAKPTEDSYIVAEGYKTKAEYHDMFHDLKLWKHRVVELLERHGLGEQEREASGGEEILMELVAGQNPIFRTPTTIIKFYSHLYGGTPSHHAEVSSLTRLHEHLPPNYGAQLPRLFASGTLFTDGHKGWNWPYVVIQVVNAISVGNVWGGQWGGRRVGNGGEDEGEDEDGDENGNGDVDGDGDGDGDGDEGGGENGIVEWEETVDWVAEMLKAVHSIPPDDTFAPTHLGWTAFLANKLRTAVTRHRSWAIFPSHLLDQLEAYLPASVEELVPEDRARWATLLHGDLNPDNVMGYIDVVGYVEAVTPPPQLNAPPAEPPQIVYAPPPGPPPPVIYSPPPGPPPSAVYSPPPGPPPPAIYSPQPGPTPVVYAPPPGPPPLLDQPIVTTTSSADVDPPNRIPRYHWRPTHLIDFGDAHPSGGDPLFDLVPFVVTTLGCRKDLMQRFVDVYNRGEGPRIEKKEFVRRALCYVLLWEFPGIPKAVVKCVPALKACGSWKEVEEVVWGGVWE